MRSARPTQVITFAACLGAVLGLFVSTAATLLAPRIARNIELERQHQVLLATGLVPPDSAASVRATAAIYAARIVEEQLAVGDQRLPLYRAVDERGATVARCFPVEGPGLWGVIRGYLALDADATHVVGVTFYEHRETPGLGAQIESPRWTQRWRGKAVVDDYGELTGVDVVHGAVDETDDWQAAHAVDGISGATITSHAVERLTRAGLERYRPYLEELWADL